MSEEEKEVLKESAKSYIRQLFLKHRCDDEDALGHFVDLLWMQIDIMIAKHEKEKHNG